MISIKKYLLILFCLLCTGLTHCANSQQEITFPEAQGYTAVVPITDYFTSVRIGNKYKHLPATIPFSHADTVFHFTSQHSPYKGDLEIDYLEFTTENRKEILGRDKTNIMDGVKRINLNEPAHSN